MYSGVLRISYTGTGVHYCRYSLIISRRRSSYHTILFFVFAYSVTPNRDLFFGNGGDSKKKELIWVVPRAKKVTFGNSR